MGTKYDFRNVRTDMMNHLAVYFPDTYGVYKQRSAKHHTITFTDEDIFELLALARREDARTIHPYLFYLCAARPASHIAELSDSLTKEDRSLCFDGHDKLQKRSFQMFFAALQSENCGRDARNFFIHDNLCTNFFCMARFRELLEQHLNFNNYDLPLFPLRTSKTGILEYVDWVMDDIEEECGKRYMATLEKIRKSVWEDLPMIFGLGDWDQVKASASIEVD